MSILKKLPSGTVGLRLCKAPKGTLIMCDDVIFVDGAKAVDTVLRRAELSGNVGPIGQTGDYWADIIDAHGDMLETVSLDRESWNALKNHWMRCSIWGADQ